MGQHILFSVLSLFVYSEIIYAVDFKNGQYLLKITKAFVATLIYLHLKGFAANRRN